MRLLISADLSVYGVARIAERIRVAEDGLGVAVHRRGMGGGSTRTSG